MSGQRAGSFAAGMRARDIKAELTDSGVDTSDLFDKEDLAKRVLTAIPSSGAIRFRLIKVLLLAWAFLLWPRGSPGFQCPAESH